MKKHDRFDETALEIVFECASFRAALESQNDGELAVALAAQLRTWYGSDAEQEAYENQVKSAPKRARQPPKLTPATTLCGPVPKRKGKR